MNVVILCNSYPTLKNPHSQIFIKNMKENLEKQEGVSVDVCYNKIFDIWKNASKKKDVFSNIIKYSVFILSIIYFLIRRRKKIDILFPQAIVFPTVFAAVIKKILNIPMVCYVHGGDVNSYPEASSLYKSLMESALRNCDWVIVNSKDMQKKVCDISQHKNVEIISPGVDTTMMRMLHQKKQLRNEFNLPQDKFLLFTAGDAIKRKGYDIFLESLLHIKKPIFEKIFVLIVTEGPEKENLQYFIKKHNLQKQVRIDNKVNQEELNKYYNAVDLFIFPSRQEPLGLVGLEAMAAGIPVVASEVGGIPDYVKDSKNGLLFKPEDAVDLASKITELTSDPSLYNKLCENTPIYPKKYSVTQAARRISDTFLKLYNQA